MGISKKFVFIFGREWNVWFTTKTKLYDSWNWLYRLRYKICLLRYTSFTLNAIRHNECVVNDWCCQNKQYPKIWNLLRNELLIAIHVLRWTPNRTTVSMKHLNVISLFLQWDRQKLSPECQYVYFIINKTTSHSLYNSLIAFTFVQYQWSLLQMCF